MLDPAKVRQLQTRLGVGVDGIFGPATLDAALTALGGTPSHKRQLGDPEAFYRGVRAVTGQLNQMQVDVINDLLSGAAHWSVAWLAYGLATAWHEARLVPVEEIGKGRLKPYGVPGKHGGQAAYGRGLVQLTWADNYAKADAEIGLNGALLADYALALRPDIAAAILIRGMEEGWFTGKSLATYLPDERGTQAQFREARRIINGTDRDALIAGYALKMQDALSAGGWA